MEGLKVVAKRVGRVRLDTGQHRRILIVAVLLGVLGFVPIGVRLYELMVVQYEYYAHKALQNQSRTTSVSADRGYIYDINMNVLACSKTVEHVYLDPHELKQADTDIEKLSVYLGTLLNKDPKWIEAQAADTTMRYKQVAASIDRETASKLRNYINSNSIRGVHLEPASKRIYPMGTLASQVIGFVNSSGDGCNQKHQKNNKWKSFLHK